MYEVELLTADGVGESWVNALDGAILRMSGLMRCCGESCTRQTSCWG